MRLPAYCTHLIAGSAHRTSSSGSNQSARRASERRNKWAGQWGDEGSEEVSRRRRFEMINDGRVGRSGEGRRKAGCTMGTRQAGDAWPAGCTASCSFTQNRPAPPREIPLASDEEAMAKDCFNTFNTKGGSANMSRHTSAAGPLLRTSIPESSAGSEHICTSNQPRNERYECQTHASAAVEMHFGSYVIQCEMGDGEWGRGMGNSEGRGGEEEEGKDADTA